MNLLVKAKKNSQEIVSVTPRSAGWRYVGFSAHQLAPEESLTLSDFNVMAGPKRVWHFYNDPAHEWIL